MTYLWIGPLALSTLFDGGPFPRGLCLVYRIYRRSNRGNGGSRARTSWYSRRNGCIFRAISRCCRVPDRVGDAEAVGNFGASCGPPEECDPLAAATVSERVFDRLRHYRCDHWLPVCLSKRGCGGRSRPRRQLADDDWCSTTLSGSRIIVGFQRSVPAVHMFGTNLIADWLALRQLPPLAGRRNRLP